ncbi:OsmC family protein [Kineococcus glutinatus]|uniref:Organic hydroperoxide resistance protein n=1 Tax=Kineococcus glutinatus TaxID=1070872 RepID=A0ABP9H581_9ACTN
MPEDLYTAVVTATPGAARSSDDALSVTVSEPGELGGSGDGTNPEQLMAAALGSCLLESLRIAASTRGASIDDASVEARVTLASASGPGYTATYALQVSLPGVEDAAGVLAEAQSLCPFTKTLDASTLDVQLAGS